jgi:phage repressor protein C with HTH and peptisase S24 domain
MIKVKYKTVLDNLQNLTRTKIGHAWVSNACKVQGVEVSAGALQNRLAKDGYIKDEELKAIAYYVGYNVEDISGLRIDGADCITLAYRPEVYLSAGYGVEVLDEHQETIMIDSRLLAKESGGKLNYSMCEVVMISGNSMSPEYRHGDRVIIDKGDTELADGHIFAFRYQGQCYVKEINLLGNRIKCISLNKEYDPFYINEDEDFLVFGRIIPRIRL